MGPVEKTMIEILVFIFGAMIGSFLNVCIVRMPQEKSIAFPRSHCVHCQQLIPWHDNIPLLSYFLLGRKCRYCHKKISARYFVVELVTAGSFVLFYRFFGLHLVLIPYLVFHCGLIVATFVDLEHRIIPDEISVGGMIAGLIFSFLIPQLHDTSLHLWGLGRSLWGVLIGGGSIYAMGMLGDFLFKKESMGGGDVKLLAMAGAFLGWKMALVTFFIAPFFGAFFGLIVKLRTKESVIPYGPFLSAGALMSLFWGKEILHWVLYNYGMG